MLDLRGDFPQLEGNTLCYLDSAATALKPKIVLDTLLNFYRTRYATVHRAIYQEAIEATKEYEAVRENVRDFLNAKKSSEIIFTRGTTASLNIVARSFATAFLKKGDKVLIPEIEHHSNFVPWQQVCAQIGALLEFIPVTAAGAIDLEAFRELLDERVKIVSLAHISNVLGSVHPIKEIARLAHAVGAKVCIDGAQAAPHVLLDVQDLDIDFYAFSGHKAYGPTGVGVLYGKEELLEALPPVEWGGEMVDRVSKEKTSFTSLPLKFEPGTPMIAEVIGLGAALTYLKGIGIAKIETYLSSLTEAALVALEEFNVTIFGPKKGRGSLISFLPHGMHPLDLAHLLESSHIALRSGHLCAQPALNRLGCSSLIRVSFGIYNNHQDILNFKNALKCILSK